MKFTQNLYLLFKHWIAFAGYVRTHAPIWWSGSRHFAAQIQARMVSERTNQTAGSLTFTTMLALVPLATVVLAVFTAFPAFDKLRVALENYFIESLMPKQVASVVTSYLTLFAAKARNLSLMGAAFLVITVVAMFLTIERSMNAIWQVPPRQHSRGRWFLGRVLSYWVLLTMAPFVVGASFYATAQLVATTRGLGGGADQLGKLVLFVLPVVLSSGLWALVFKILPNTQVRWVHAVAGAVLSSILLAVLKELFVVYIGKYANFKELYGAFSVIPVLLIWIYLGWWVTLLGATFAALLPSWGTRYANPQSALQPFLAQLRVLRALSQQQTGGHGAGALSLEQLQAQVFLPASAVQQALTPLQDLGWVGKLSADNPHAAHAWVLLCPLSDMTVHPLLDAALGLDSQDQAGHSEHGWYSRWAALGECTADQAMAILEQKT